MFWKAFPLFGTSPTAVEPLSTVIVSGGASAGGASLAYCATSEGSISTNVATSVGSSARPASCFSIASALSGLSARWYGRSVVTAS